MEKFKFNRFRPGKKGLRKALGDLEAEIMELVWVEKEVSVREVHDRLGLGRDIAYTTVMTVMCRLSDKGLLEKEKVGKMYIYRPALSKENFYQSIAGSIISGLGDELARASLVYFVDNLTETDADTLAELEDLIKKKSERLNDQ